MGAFLGLIFLVIIFNTVIFVITIVILIKNYTNRNSHKKSNTIIPPKEIIKIIFSLSGIMILLGLSWILSLFTFSGARDNPDASFSLQLLFVFFNSFQGFFLFFFFVVFSSEARKLWLSILLCRKKKSKTSVTPVSKSSTVTTAVKMRDLSHKDEGQLVKAKIKRISTFKKTHHVETAEVKFEDGWSDEDENPFHEWSLLTESSSMFNSIM